MAIAPRGVEGFSKDEDTVSTCPFRVAVGGGAGDGAGMGHVIINLSGVSFIAIPFFIPA